MPLPLFFTVRFRICLSLHVRSFLYLFFKNLPLSQKHFMAARSSSCPDSFIGTTSVPHRLVPIRPGSSGVASLGPLTMTTSHCASGTSRDSEVSASGHPNLLAAHGAPPARAVAAATPSPPPSTRRAVSGPHAVDDECCCGGAGPAQRAAVPARPWAPLGGAVRAAGRRSRLGGAEEEHIGRRIGGVTRGGTESR
ncbi:hypothetical protein GQ55_3G262500 [Panicum hallii var. hallii]|uniref:Uncharacterized protein n=1 Tax=Panicum hallii var. hallii TaxID=1504633 RepID=A0A2T7EDJ5_9POAL|nr:hypothetical protein GQ55_3G262500 [Panicum hallii var. hallii]